MSIAGIQATFGGYNVLEIMNPEDNYEFNSIVREAQSLPEIGPEAEDNDPLLMEFMQNEPNLMLNPQIKQSFEEY